jgi:DNA invertase Pin-like site-specific DNA recombinase/uncharacterized protein YndB with AHSA1/START domain
MKPPLVDAQSKIRPEHRGHLAYVYIRQSSLRQVENNRESTRMQYQVALWLEEVGWPKERIVVIDEDLGKSGATPHTRSGFADLVAAVATGDVGIVAGTEVSRLARNSPEWANLMFLCRFTNTLIADETGVYDPTRSSDRLILGIRGQIAEIELETSIHRMTEARHNKARRGELVGIVPAGYERDELGRLVITSDQAVSNAIRNVFSKFDELGSARQVYAWWKSQGLQFPVRRKELRTHPVVWVVARYSMFGRVLRHPIFAGVYVYGAVETTREVAQRGSQPRLLVRRIKRKVPAVLIKEHHEGYISFEKFMANQERLRGNRTMERHQSDESSQGPVREGRALLQGLARCGYCGRRMFVAYGGRRPNWKRGSLQYLCMAESREDRGTYCQYAAGTRIDQAVVALFLEATAPAGIEAAIEAESQARSAAATIEQTWRLQIEKAEYEAQRAQRQYQAVEPENRVVARELERRWNACLVDLEKTRAQAQERVETLRPLTEAEVAKARGLGDQLGEVWRAATTTDHDRKRLLRCLIEEVQLRTEEKKYQVRVIWKGGKVTDREIPRLPKGAERATPEETVTLVGRLAAEFDDTQVARILNKQKRRSALGRSFTQEAVRCIRRAHDIPKCPPKVARDPREGPFTADEAAAELGVSMSTVHRWLREGVLAGAQATLGAPWRILLSEETRTRLSAGDAPKDWVGLTEAARRLGLSKPRVVYLVKTGKLKAARTKVGSRQCWRIDVSSTDLGRQVGLFDQTSKRLGNGA